MKKIEIKLKNCFGINSMECAFDFNKKNSVLIYSPNGVMKSSFAKTFDYIARKEKPSDLVYSERNSLFEILCDKKNISPECIFVADAEKEINANEKITTLLASKDLKNQYDKIYRDLNSEKDNFITQLKTISRSSDCESEVVDTFKDTDKDVFWDCLEKIEKEITDDKIFFDFKYNDIFDKKGNVKKFLDKHIDLIEQYFEEYQDLITNSDFFKNNNDGTSFGTYQAKKIIDSVDGDTFFKAQHKMVLRNAEEITSKSQLENVVETEINKILLDDKLKGIFIKIDSAIGANAELRAFKNLLEKNNSLIPHLYDYANFKKLVWYGCFNKIKTYYIKLLSLYKSKKQELVQILDRAREENEIWKHIIEIYKQRFYVPFSVSIENQDDVILKQDTANLVFSYKDSQGEPVKKEKDDLLRILSRGEKRAFFILQLLFELEVRKKESIESLIVFDDIADSFDYKNKYAIVEYLYELEQNTDRIFKQIILTHNFDFYRTISLRLNLGDNVYMAIRTPDSIKIFNGGYRKDFFAYMIKNIENNKIFISMIPFVRNILQYTKGKESEEYIKLTSCLHIIESEKKITVGDIFDVFKSHLFFAKDLPVNNKDKSIIDFIKEIAAGIVNETEPNEIDLENKLVLSICIRLLAEEYMINNISDKSCIKTIKTNQTRELINKFRCDNPKKFDAIKILDRVNLMTPENIHVNAFMYEPLIDMSIGHLMQLYNDICKIREQNI